jgi:colicin import membrane protein
MKRILLILLLLPILSFSQSKKELEDELKTTKAKLDSFQVLFYQQQSQYQQKITSLEATIDKIKFLIDNNVKSTYGVQSNAITGVGDTSQTKNNAKKIVLGEGDGLTPKTGGKIYTGSRGGQYYINKNGNKTYIRKKG